jgi:hypothetical protein
LVNGITVQKYTDSDCITPDGGEVSYDLYINLVVGAGGLRVYLPQYVMGDVTWLIFSAHISFDYWPVCVTEYDWTDPDPCDCSGVPICKAGEDGVATSTPCCA